RRAWGAARRGIRQRFHPAACLNGYRERSSLPESMAVIRILILLALLAVALALPATLSAQAPGVVVGAVRDALTGAPLPGVQVTAHPVEDSTAIRAGGLSDASGRFVISGLRPG